MNPVFADEILPAEETARSFLNYWPIAAVIAAVIVVAVILIVKLSKKK